MPIRWTISHPEHFVLIECFGALTRTDIEAYLDDVVVNGAMGYRKQFGLLDAVPAFADGDMMALGARIQAYVATMPRGMGPLAIVVMTEEQRENARIFAALAAGQREVKIFSDASTARRWLDTVDIGP